MPYDHYRDGKLTSLIKDINIQMFQTEDEKELEKLRISRNNLEFQLNELRKSLIKESQNV